ncbi:eukaryotic translation elongation factor 1 delta b (guanine nucleotide exchange protein) isoform X2 [Stegostoma tigrinum]|uniref:eukaryotic translation elongation factor 1 delta b (guanine nucleotide exchange protein) isoform X2 n=1 Tax=Stegostoma tigrinum TaxID=3053191 RepID=UPI002870755B|nr:eukaryotic translation elongation factor 1 delta b (guanine nucleotide exchange protein) isoform X2 [Stegostoma tigrinum]
MKIRKHPYLLETVWMDKYKFDEAERLFHEGQQASDANAVIQAAQEAELVSLTWAGAVEDGQQEQELGKKQLRKRSPRGWPAEVESSRQLEMKALPEASGPQPVKDAITNTKAVGRDIILGRETRSLIAWHQLVHGVWLNKSIFDEAERLFIIQSQGHSIPRTLHIPTSGVSAAPKLWATPDEGYVSATPITPGFPTGGDPSSLVNGMFPRASPSPLALQFWLEKPLYDDAERLYRERLHGDPAAAKEGCPQTMGQRPAAPSLTNAHQNATQCLLPPINEDPLAAARHLVHEDNEPVWFSKPMYDDAELRYHLVRIQRAADQSQNLELLQAPPVERASPAPRRLRLHDKTMAVNFLAEEKIWFDKYKYDDAEMQYYVKLNSPVTSKVLNSPAVQENGASNILRDIARARENIQKSLAGIQSAWEADDNSKETVQDNIDPTSSHSAVQCSDIEMCARVINLEKENQSLHQVVEDLRLAMSKLEARVSILEKSLVTAQPAICPQAQHNEVKPSTTKVEAKKNEDDDDDDDDVDLFGSSDEDEKAEKDRVREERLRQYAERKSKKPALIAKSSILLDVKPWDDETDMVKLEESVRTVQMDGLVWGASKLVPVGYGIKKLQIQCVVEDDKVGTDQLEEEITKFEDYVQSVDIAAFNKI